MSIQGVTINCEADSYLRGKFETVQVAEKDPHLAMGYVSPVLDLIGLALIVFPHEQKSRSRGTTGAGLDNQVATYIMIERDDGFAKPRWQCQVGNVTVIRADKQPLTPAAIETIWMYFDHLLQIFPDSPGTAQGLMTREYFDKFCHEYRGDKIENSYDVKKFEELKLPL